MVVQMVVTAFDGTIIVLTEERWRHIISRHPELEKDKSLILDVVAAPDEAYVDVTGEIHVLKRVNGVSDFLVVIYRVNGEGYIRTAHYTNTKGKTRRYRLFRKLKPS